ncbi:hypothetical protein RvY_04120 [Ramazzottius varieornatus]|uniref:Lysosomal dipeptide transporter MFSD1 n=1 Tax=Ramazzottius varieornatus TaxID=947166 RepID=A0A1D1UU23_RAMVA|nr:hypothetical protein RvY_04120 [Ramazzottius varieornatus]
MGSGCSYLLSGSVLDAIGMRNAIWISATQHYTEQGAIWIAGVVYLMSIVIPFTGYLVDEGGYRDWWMAAGAALILSPFAACLALTSFNSIRMSALIGLGYAIFDSVSSSSTNIVAPDNTKGTANAILKFLRYFAVGSFALVAGTLLDQQKKKTEGGTVWINLLTRLLIMSVLATCGSLVMVWAKLKSKEKPLSLKEKEHRRHKREQKARSRKRIRAKNYPRYWKQRSYKSRYPKILRTL